MSVAFEQVVRLFEEKKYQDALTAFEQIFTDDQCDTELWRKKGNILEKIYYEKGLDAYNKAIELNNDNYWAWHSKGNLLIKMKRYQEALGAYDEAIRIGDLPGDDWNNKACAYYLMKDYDSALACVHTALSFEDQSTKFLVHHALIMRAKGQLDKAREILEKAKSNDPNHPKVWLNLGVILAELGDVNAEEHLLKAIELNPALVPAYRDLGIFYLKQDNEQEGRKYLQKYLEQIPTPDAEIEKLVKLLA